jgi:hypothetical protein
MDAREFRHALAAVAHVMNQQVGDWARLSGEQHVAIASDALNAGDLAAACAALLCALEQHERARIACMVSTADAPARSIVKEKLNIFSSASHTIGRPSKKMWWGVGRGLESEMRSRDDLRRQARTLFPGQRRRSRRATDE